jgi:hypothetical protein
MRRRVLSLFQERGIDDISDIDACVDELRDIRLRAEFIIKFKLLDLARSGHGKFRHRPKVIRLLFFP